MTHDVQTPTEPPIVNDRGFALAVYILYLIGFLTGFTALIGVIIAHVKAPNATASLQTHFRFQIYTFWIGFAFLILGWLLSYLGVGFLILAWWFVWTLTRCIKGLIYVNEGRPIVKPTSWLFG